MEDDELVPRKKKRVALVAHDNKKRDLLEWAKYNRDLLDEHELSFPFQELTLFKGMEGYPELFAEPRALRENYLAELQSFLGRVRHECLDNRIDYQRLSTSQPLDVALSSYLATRMALVRR